MKPFNSPGGYSVGTNRTTVIDANSNVTSNVVYTPAIVQNNGYDVRLELSGPAGVLQANVNGNTTQFLPGGQIRLSSVGTIFSGTYDGSQLVLATAQSQLNQLRGGNVLIQTGANSNVGNTWTFGSDGSLAVPGEVNVTGNVIPTTTNTYFLGNSTHRWANLWLGPGTIYITDTANTANTAELTVNNGILQVNGTAGLQANLVSGNTTLTLANSGNISMSVGGSNNSAVFTSNGIISNTFTGDGGRLSNINAANIVGGYGNSNVAAYLPTYTGSFTLLGGNVFTTANVSANYVSGNGSQLTGMYSNVNVNNYLPLYMGNLVSLTGNVTTTGNVNGNIITGNTSNVSGNATVGNLIVTGNIFANPIYGSFWSNTTQSTANVNVVQLMTFNNTDGHNSVVLGNGASNTRMIINHAGIYNVQFSVQIDKTSTKSDSVYIWLRQNGQDLANTAGYFSIAQNAATVQSWNFIVNAANVGDYVELAFATNDTTISFPAYPAQTTPYVRPEIPSVIATIVPVGG
jgi:hypothetical protein